MTDVVELRQYTLHPGRRDVLIELFDRELVESQEAHGMTIIGQFRDLDDPDRFVWLRGFGDMTTRARSLEAFYDGPVWARHRDAANATMIDSDNVLLLRPVRPESAFKLDERAPTSSRLIVANVYYPISSAAEEFAELFSTSVEPALRATGASILAVLVTEPGRNTFPRLPVREGETVLAVFTAHADERAYEDHLSAWKRRALSDELARRVSLIEVLRLRPTERSRCR